MKHDILAILNDIEDSISKVKEYVKNIDYNDYVESTIVQDAVERRFEIIGEAVSRLKKEYPNEFKKISFGEQVITTRHKVIHDYDRVDSSIIFQSTGADLDLLKEEIIKIQNSQHQETPNKRRGIKR